MIRPSVFMCKGYNCSTGKCRVYEKRTETYPCNNVTPQNTLELHARGILPDSCAYVRYKKGLPPLAVVPPIKMVPYEKAPKIVKQQFDVETKRWVAAKKEEKRQKNKINSKD
ncbi:MAG: putative cysteine cluster protein YcgN (CxxCxxCC family) [Zhongshania aliphaticivorans]|jgi:uncharacterized cysteine cluster protein YcgN (CxxCxxCC family)